MKFFYNSFQLRQIVIDSRNDNCFVNICIFMGYDVSHPIYCVPRYFGIFVQRLTVFFHQFAHMFTNDL